MFPQRFNFRGGEKANYCLKTLVSSSWRCLPFLQTGRTGLRFFYKQSRNQDLLIFQLAVPVYFCGLLQIIIASFSTSQSPVQFVAAVGGQAAFPALRGGAHVEEIWCKLDTQCVQISQYSKAE